jgi:hypothetical protein
MTDTARLSAEEAKTRFGYSFVDDDPDEEGLRLAGQDGKEFHIRPDGTPAYEEQFDAAEPFRPDGQARVMNGHDRFDIRPDGTRV